MAGKKKGFLPRRKLANNPIELGISLASAALTVGYVVYEAIRQSREYKKMEEEKKAKDKQ